MCVQAYRTPIDPPEFDDEPLLNESGASPAAASREETLLKRMAAENIVDEFVVFKEVRA